MKDEFERYFPDISKLEFDIVQNPFSINLYETNPIPDDMNQAQEFIGNFQKFFPLEILVSND